MNIIYNWNIKMYIHKMSTEEGHVNDKIGNSLTRLQQFVLIASK